MEEIKKDHKDHESERKKAVLDKWKEKKGDDATYICLIEAFYKAENIELLDSTLEYLRENCKALHACILVNNNNS